jgi:hypothetical protein
MTPTATAGTRAGELDERDLLRLTNKELDVLFRSSPPGPLPRGRLPGTAVLFPGSWICRVLARLVHLLFWQGKVTDASSRTLKNFIGPFGTPAIKALISYDRSWVDGEECVLIDYSRTSLVAGMVRDEVRLVSPKLYLGVVWLWKWRTAWFTVRQQ